jgi:hypothetical protein
VGAVQLFNFADFAQGARYLNVVFASGPSVRP